MNAPSPTPSTRSNGPFILSRIASGLRRYRAGTAERPSRPGPHRRYQVETLEPRLLLSADLAPGAAQALIDGLEGFANWANELDDFDELSQPLPLVDTPLGDLLDLGDLIQENLVDPLVSAAATTTAEVATAIDDALDTLLGFGDYVTDLTDQVTGEYRFKVDFDYGVDESLDFGVGEAFDALGLGFETQVNLAANIGLSFEFGLSLTPGLDPADAFFIDLSDPDAGVSLGGTIDADLNTGFDLGFIEASIVAGSVDLSAFLDVNLPDPGGDNLLSLSELSSASIDDSVLQAAAGNSFAASLPIQASLAGIDADDVLDSALTITGLDGTNLFAAPAFSISVDSPVLADFTNIKPGDVAGMLQSLGAQLDFLTDVLDVTGGIPYLSDGISDVASFAQMLEELAQNLFDVGVQAVSLLGDLTTLSGSLGFDISVDGAAPVTIAIDFSAIDEPAELLTALNTELAAQGIDVEATLEEGQLLLSATDAAIKEFELSGVDPALAAVLGLENTMFGLPLFQFTTVQGFIGLLNESALANTPFEASYDATTNSILFNLDISRQFEKDVLMNFSESLDLGVGELVLSGGASASFGVSADLDLGVGIDIGSLEGTTSLGDLNGGAGIRIADGADFNITLTDGTTAPVDLSTLDTNDDDVLNGDDSQTVQDLIDLIVGAVGAGKLAIEPNGAQGNLLFRDLTSGGGSLLISSAATSSPALIDLGILISAGGTEEGEIAAGIILPRFFIQEDSSSISATASISADDIDLTAALGFLEIGVEDGSLGETTIAASLSLQDPSSDGRVFLNELASKDSDGVDAFFLSIADVNFDLTAGDLSLPLVFPDADTLGLDLDLLEAVPEITVTFLEDIAAGAGGLSELSLDLDIDFDTTAIQELLESFQNLSIGQLIQLVLAIGESIASDFDLFNYELPLVDTSINDILELANQGLEQILDGELGQRIKNLKAELNSLLDDNLGDFVDGSFQLTLPTLSTSDAGEVLAALDAAGLQHEFFQSINNLLAAIEDLPENFDLLTTANPTQLISAFNSFFAVTKRIVEEDLPGVAPALEQDLRDALEAFTAEARDLVPSTDTIVQLLFEALGFELPDLSSVLADLDEDAIRTLLIDTVNDALVAGADSIKAELQDFEDNLPANVPSVQDAIDAIGEAEQIIGRLEGLLEDVSALRLMDFVRLFGLSDDLLQQIETAIEVVESALNDPDLAAGALKDSLQAQFDELVVDVRDAVTANVVEAVQDALGGNLLTFRFDENNTLLVNLHIDASVMESEGFELDFGLTGPGATAIPLNFDSTIEGELDLAGSLDLGFGLNITGGTPQIFLQTESAAELQLGLALEGFAELSIFGLSASFGNPDFPDPESAVISLTDAVDDGMGGLEAGVDNASIALSLIDNDGTDDGLILLGDINTGTFDPTVNAFLQASLPVYTNGTGVFAPSGPVEVVAAEAPDLDFDSAQLFSISVNGLDAVQVSVPAYSGGSPGDPYPSVASLATAIDAALTAATFTDMGIFKDGNLGQLFDAQDDGGVLKLAVKAGLTDSPSTMELSGSGLSTLGFTGDTTNATELVNIGFETAITAFSADGFDFSIDGLDQAEIDAIIGSFTELNLANLFAAIETVLQILESALGADFIDGLPVLDDAADVIGDGVGFLRDAFDQMKAALENVPDALGDLGEWVNDQIATAVTNAIGTAEGAAGSEVNDLLLDLIPTIRFTLGGADIDTADFDADELLSDPDLGVEIDFDFDYMKDFETSFDLGLDALIFEVETSGGIEVNFEAGLEFTLGLGLLTGPYLKFSDDPDTDEVFASLSAGLTDGTSISARLFFLELVATELTGDFGDDTYEGVNISGDIGVDLGTGVIEKFSDLSFDLSSDIAVDIDLLISAGVDAGTDGTLPSIEVKMNTDWEYDLTSGEVPELPTLEFNDLSLDLGEFFDLTFGPILEQLEPFTSALDPIFEILNTEIPLVSDLAKLLGQDPITFLSAIELLGSGFDSVRTFLNVATTVNDVLDLIQEVGDTGKINFGDMDFGGIDLTQVTSANVLDDALNTVTTTAETLRSAFTDSAATSELVTKAESSAGFDTSGGLGISFDIIENPASLFNLLLGETVDLVSWDIPRLAAEFNFGMSFGPIIPPIPLFATVDLSAELFADFGIGFDTRGLATGSFFNGFYFDDWNDAGEDILELGLGVEASVGAELNVVVASAGVNGGVRAEIGANWNDPNDDGKVYLDELALNFARGVECVFDLEGALSAFFDAFVKIGFDTPFGFVTIFSETLNLLDVTLLDFSLSCPPLPPPLPATLSGDDILLNIGDRAGERQPGATDVAEEIFVLSEIDRNGDGVLTPLRDINENGVIEQTELEGVEDLDGDGELSSNVVGVLGFGQFQLFTDANPTGLDSATTSAIREVVITSLSQSETQIIGNAGDEDDIITIDPSVVFGAVITGGAGADEIFGGSGNDNLSGDAGEDTIRGGLGDDVIAGGDDSDDIRGNAGSDELDGNGAEDAVFGEDGINAQRSFVEGEADFDLIAKLNAALASAGFSALGAPTYEDDITGGDGADDLRGDFGSDVIYGNAGNDNITGGWGDDELTGNEETDLIEGGAGSDSIWGDNRFDDAATGNDVLFGEGAGVSAGEGGNDTVFGGPGNDTIRDAYDSEEADPEDNVDEGDDAFYGGDGEDLLVTGVGNDRAFGGAGVDEILSGDDNDYVEGGGSGDTIDSGAGSDLVIGGSSPYANSINDNFEGVPLSYVGPDPLDGVDGATDADFSGTDGGDTIAAGGDDDIVIGDNGAFYKDGQVSTRVQLVDLDYATTFSDGGAGADEIRAGGGDDIAFGGGASDTIFADPIGGAGSDIAVGDQGYLEAAQLVAVHSDVAGAAGDDTLYGRSGVDILIGGTGNDTAFGDAGADVLAGDNVVVKLGGLSSVPTGANVEVLRVTSSDTAEGGNDFLYGNLGSDLAIGGVGNDVIRGGGSGDAPTVADSAGDILLGDNGTVVYADTSDAWDIFSTAPGDSGEDDIIASARQDIVIGGGADDTLNGLGNDDVVIGDNGRLERDSATEITRIATTETDQGGVDNIVGDEGDDLLIGGFAGDDISGNGGEDIILGDNGEVLLNGIVDAALGNALVQGNAVTRIFTTDTTAGTGGADTIGGDAGNDIALGGVAGDTMEGDDGDDILLGDGGEVRFDEGDSDYSTLDAVRSYLDQPGGTDTISGQADADVIMGGREGDTLYGDADTTAAGDGSDVVLGDNGELLLGDDAGERLIRGAPFLTLSTTDITAATGGVDVIEGNDANDILLGGTAGDTINGNDGDDIALGDNGRLEWGYDFNGDAFFGGLGDDNDLTTLDIITTQLPAAQPGGRDTIQGDDGSDIILGGTDADTLYGDEGDEAGEAGTNDDLIFGDHGAVYPQQATHSSLNSRNFFAIDTADSDGGEGDRIWGEGGADIILGQQGDDRLFGGDDDDDLIGGHNVAGGVDELSAPVIVTTGSDVSDVVDGGTGDDALAGDNATIWRNDSDVGVRYQALTGELLYKTDVADTDPLYGTADVTGVAQSNPDEGPGRSITLLDHSETTVDGLYGNDYLAGNADNDLLFGQLGDDIVQGDGAIGDDDGNPDSPTTALTTTDSLGATGGVLYFNVYEAATDGDDYAEGNGGEDLLFGGLGQDDIIGGSSDVYGLNTVAERPDGSDTIYGGAANPDRIARNAVTEAGDTLISEANRHSRDSDVIAGDNAAIYRIVGTGGDDSGAYFTFNYDEVLAPERDAPIVVRAVTLLDHDPEQAVAGVTQGEGDWIWGESGDDFIHAMMGADVVYGDAENDDIFGEQGPDWISGGTGADGVLGDTGLMATSRNSSDYGEPLYGIEALSNRDLNLYIDTPGDIQQSIINLEGALKKTVDLTPFDVGADDIIYGGLDDDALHGGAGDDAMSGAEALEDVAAAVNGTVYQSGYSTPANPGGVLGFDADSEEFALYDEFNPRTKILVDVGGDDKEFLLNFEAFTDVNDQVGTMIHDGNDVLFGDLGNDWMVGGTDLDRLYGGYGSDLLNIDDNHETNGGLNDEPDDPAFAGSGYLLSDYRGADLAYGGAGRDVMINNTGADRMSDWVGEFNSYITPYAPFGQFSVSRSLQPQLQEYLLDLSESDGSDPTRSQDTGSDASRNGEPEGELGMVLQKDFDWQDQTGAPNDPQAGNIPGGKRDVMEEDDFNDGKPGNMAAESGDWTIASGALQGSSVDSGDAISFMHVADQLPSYYEITATVNADKDKAGVKSNGYVLIDFQSATDFKFAGINPATDKLEIGQRTADGWIVEAQSNMRLRADTNYNLLVAVNGTTVTLVVDGAQSISHGFDARDVGGVSVGLNFGYVGVGMNNSITSFDNIAVQKLPPEITFTQLEDFADGSATGFTPLSGDWNIANDAYSGETGDDGFALSGFDLNVSTSAYLAVAAELVTNGIAGVAFDHYDDGRFKFSVIDAENDRVVIGHYTSKSGFVVDAAADFAVSTAGGHQLEVGLSGSTVSVKVDGQVVLGSVYNALVNDGGLGAFVLSGGATYTSIAALTDDPAYGDPLMAASLGNGHTPLEEGVLDAVAQVARIQWADSGLLDVDALAALEHLSFEVEDLTGRLLGSERDGVILIDADAAGHGWAVDGNAAVASAAGQMDLLTAVNHEIGHALGFRHGAMPLMDSTLEAGERHLPGEVDQAGYLAMDDDGELVYRDHSASAGKITREILAGRMVDWSLQERP